MQIGNVFIPAVRIFKAGEISRPIETIPGLGHRGYGLAEFEAELPQAILEGSLLQLYGNSRTLQQYKEDLEALSLRGAGYNSISNVKSRSGWISVKSVDVDDETGVLWPFSLTGTWFDSSQYGSVLAADPVTMANDWGIVGSYDINVVKAAADVRCFDGSLEIFSPFHVFTENCIIENGLYRVSLGDGVVSISYWDTDEYILIDNFSAGTFSDIRVDILTTDIMQCHTSNGILITLERGRIPHICSPVGLVCDELTPDDQSTDADNYLVLDTGLYVCSDRAFSISSGSIDAGYMWIFRAVSGAQALAHNALVKSNLCRNIVRR